MRWHVFVFTCRKCGREATIMEVAANACGQIAMAGVCVICGIQFSQECSMAKMIGTCAVLDIQKRTPEQAMLDDYELGDHKPS